MDARAHVDPEVREALDMQRPMLAIISICVGLLCGAGPLFSPVPAAVTSVGVVEGLFWVALGIGVWRGEPSTIRKCIALIMSSIAVGSLLWIVAPGDHSMHADAYNIAPWKRVVVSSVCLVLSIGIWRASEWARRTAIFVGVAYVAFLVAAITVFGNVASEGSRLLAPIMLFASAVGMILLPYSLIRFCCQRSTREHFAEARGSR
jgi:hypothetical protein